MNGTCTYLSEIAKTLLLIVLVQLPGYAESKNISSLLKVEMFETESQISLEFTFSEMPDKYYSYAMKDPNTLILDCYNTEVQGKTDQLDMPSPISQMSIDSYPIENGRTMVQVSLRVQQRVPYHIVEDNKSLILVLKRNMPEINTSTKVSPKKTKRRIHSYVTGLTQSETETAITLWVLFDRIPIRYFRYAVKSSNSIIIDCFGTKVDNAITMLDMPRPVDEFTIEKATALKNRTVTRLRISLKENIPFSIIEDDGNICVTLQTGSDTQPKGQILLAAQKR